MWSPLFERRERGGPWSRATGAGTRRGPPLRAAAPIRWFAGLPVALLLCGVCSCGALTRAQECEAVIEVVNSGLADARFAAPDAGRDAEAYEAIAGTYDDVGKKLEALELTDAALAKAVAAYRELVDRSANHSRSYARELASRPRSRGARRSWERRLERLRNQARADVTREASVVRKLNTLCHPH